MFACGDLLVSKPGSVVVTVFAGRPSCPVELTGWEPELDHEHDDYRWCSRDAAMELLFWPEPAALLRSLP